MLVEYPDSKVHLDFIEADLENVREAIEGGAIGIDGEPAAVVLARLERASVRVTDANGRWLGTMRLDMNGVAEWDEGSIVFDDDERKLLVRESWAVERGITRAPEPSGVVLLERSDGLAYLEAFTDATQTGYVNATLDPGNAPARGAG